MGLNVADLDAMTDWYCTAFDLKVEFEFALDHVDFHGVMLLSPAGHRIELLHRPGSVDGLQAANPVEAALTRGFGHVAFDVPDVDAAYDAPRRCRRHRPDVAATVARAGRADGLRGRPRGQPRRAARPNGGRSDDRPARGQDRADHRRRRRHGRRRRVDVRGRGCARGRLRPRPWRVPRRPRPRCAPRAARSPAWAAWTSATRTRPGPGWTPPWRRTTASTSSTTTPAPSGSAPSTS